MSDRLLKRMVGLDLNEMYECRREPVTVKDIVDAVAYLPDDEILGVATLMLHKVRDPHALIKWVTESLIGD